MIRKSNNQYCDDLECNKITDRIHSYYKSIQDSDEEEIKTIISKTMGYLMKVTWDDTALSMEELSNKIKDTSHNIKEHQPLWNWKPF